MSDLLILASGTGSQAENPLLCDEGLGAVEDRDYTPSTSVDRTCRKPLTNKQRGEKFSGTQKAEQRSVRVISKQPIKEGVMKRRRTLAVSVGTLALGGLLLVSGGPGVTPAGAQNPTPQQQQLRQILDKLDQILAATKSASGGGEATKSGGGGAEDNNTLRWDQALSAAQRFVILPAFNSDAVLDKETGLVWEKSPQTTAVSSANVRLICANKAVGGRKGWRLPSLPELASLVDPP
jgi:hypothetical protein